MTYEPGTRLGHEAERLRHLADINGLDGTGLWRASMREAALDPRPDVTPLVVMRRALDGYRIDHRAPDPGIDPRPHG